MKYALLAMLLAILIGGSWSIHRTLLKMRDNLNYANETRPSDVLPAPNSITFTPGTFYTLPFSCTNTTIAGAGTTSTIFIVPNPTQGYCLNTTEECKPGNPTFVGPSKEP